MVDNVCRYKSLNISIGTKNTQMLESVNVNVSLNKCVIKLF